jgi:cystathionine beta-lyase
LEAESLNYNFDQIINRTGTRSLKWDQSERLFGNKDLLPMWVADMDFQAPPEVVEALVRRAEHGIFGYTFRTDEYKEAILRWQETRHGWKPDPSWLCACPPGVVTALSVLVDTLTVPGDRVMLQTPVYHPFYDVVAKNGRQFVRSPLRYADGRYEMDFELIERQIAEEQVKMILLCSPHNPVGRVWTRQELETLGEICLRYGVVILSDEIHGDLVYQGHKHIPFASISERFAQQSVVCTAPSKTFNIAGLHSSNIFIANPEWREAFLKKMQALALGTENNFTVVAAETCYTHGAPWLDALLAYLEENVNGLERFVQERLPEVRVIRPEGTYLVWMDARSITTDPAEMKKLMFQQARVAFSEGSMFGKEGAGFVRVNIACPRSLMLEGLNRFAEAVKQR